MMGNIYLMRHGQSVVNVEHRLTCKKLEGDLTDLGREQAAKAGDWLRDKGITRIAHSPFHRAEQTAQIINERLNVPLSMDDDLREMNCGDLEWRTDADGWHIWEGVYQRWMLGEMEAAFPGGESYRQAQERYQRALLRMKPDETLLLVAHGGITITVVPVLCVNAAALQRDRRLDNTGVVLLEPYGDGRFICRAWNWTDHLREV